MAFALPSLVIVLMAACDGSTPERTLQDAPETPVSTPDTPPETPSASVAGEGPATLSVLRLTPSSITVSVAFPSSDALFDDWVRLVKRFAPHGDAIQDWVKGLLKEGAKQFDAPGAATLGDLLVRKGIDPKAPAGLFIDTRPMDEAYGRALSALDGATRSGEAGASRPIAVDATPAWAVAFRVTDQAKAEETARAFVASGDVRATANMVDGSGKGVNLQVSNASGLGFLLRDGWLVMANSQPLLKGVSERFENPADVRYGTPECPALHANESVALLRVDRMLNSVRAALPVVGVLWPELAPWLEVQYPLVERAAEAYSDDPAIVTLQESPDKVELLSRLDYARHPNVERIFGNPAPLKLASLLPSTTTGLLSVRITDETKETLESTWFARLGDKRARDPQVERTLVLLRLLLGLTRNHFALGVTDLAEGLPRGVVVVEVDNPDMTRMWLMTMGMTLDADETYHGVDIMTIPPPVHAYFAFLGNLLLMSNDRALLKASLDLGQEGVEPTLFASLEPPFDARQPRYNALVLTNDFFVKVLRPLLAALIPTSDDSLVRSLDNVVAHVQQVRAGRSVEGGWREGRVTVYLRTNDQ